MTLYARRSIHHSLGPSERLLEQFWLKITNYLGTEVEQLSIVTLCSKYSEL